MRNNSMHANCIGMKVVLANGTVLDNMHLPRKDNTGYHLKHLFIGAEGTLGIITECSLLCYPIEQNKSTAMLACSSIEDVTSILKLAKRNLGRNLSAFELLDKQTCEIVQQQFPEKAKYPFKVSHPFQVLVEVTTDDTLDANELLYDLIFHVEDDILDGVVAQDKKQADQLWFLRKESVNAGVNYGLVSAYSYLIIFLDS